MLNRLMIENYKSLHKLDIQLPRFGVFVGANATGKSNLMDSIEFLSSIARNGLPAAISDKGGYDNICFRRARRAKGAIRFSIQNSMALEPWIEMNDCKTELVFAYDFSFSSQSRSIKSGYSVKHESLFLDYHELDTSTKWSGPLYEFPTNRREDSLINKHFPETLLVPPPQVLEAVIQRHEKTSPKDDLLLVSSLRGISPALHLLNELSSMRVFQVMPSDARKPASASGSSEMGKHGDNMPAALNALQREAPESFDLLLEHLRLAVPSVEKVELGYVETRELGLFLKERGMSRNMYASELSDGTVRTIGLFLPIVDSRYSVVVIEEPENCVHPWVIRRFVDSCRECAKSKQILLTTHSPELVSQLKPEELFIVDRIDGQTRIQPAKDIAAAIEVANKGMMNLGEYWDSGAIGGVPEQLTLPLS